jgi:rod shape-determining protein MreD
VTLTPGAFVRTGVLVLLVVVIQISGIQSMPILGGTIDLTPLLVATVAIYAGSISGAIVGFSTGILLDLAIGQTLGLSSLVLTAVGYGVGRYRDLRDPSHGLLPIPVAAAATAGYLTAIAGVSFMLEIGASVSLLVLREAIITTLLNVALALPFFTLIRRVLRPVLAVDPMQRMRRRAGASPTPPGPLGLRGLEVNR